MNETKKTLIKGYLEALERKLASEEDLRIIGEGLEVECNSFNPDEPPIVYAEEGEDFQEYVYNVFKEDNKVPAGTAIGIEVDNELFLFDDISYSNNPRKE